MKRLGKGNRRLESYEDEGFLGPINPVAESLEITVEGDLAVVKVEGEEVEAVKIEEGDDLIQVVEEIQADYLEGKKGKRKLQEGMVTPIKVADRQDSMGWDGVQEGASRLIDGIISAEEFLEKIDEIASDRTMASIRKIWTGEDVPFIAFEHSGGTEDAGIFIQFGIVDGDLYDDA